MAKKDTEKDIVGELESAGLEPTFHEGDWPEIVKEEPPPISSLVLTKRGYMKSGSRVPPAVSGIQVNFCKNPLCGNYGVPAMAERPTKAIRLRRSGHAVS